VPLYDTEGGWLQLSTAELVNGALASRAAGWPGVKLKVGKPQVEQDLERLRAVRAAVGPGLDLMMDASQSLTHAEARRRAAAFEPLGAVRGPDLGGTADRRRLGACPGRPQTAEYEGAPDRRPGLPLSRSADLDLDLVQPLGLAWFEEPLPADDVAGHASLAASTSIPVAVGESLYSVGQFRDYLARGAASIVQADVARVGGITPWLKIAHLAEAFNVHICPHFLMELHVSLVAAVPNGRYVEHIPQLRAITRSSLRIENGHAVAPEAPGLGIDWDFDAIDDRTVA
jgi:L-alanine-DL-glutamate epimerase-like enolase superfamily enzyme